MSEGKTFNDHLAILTGVQEHEGRRPCLSSVVSAQPQADAGHRLASAAGRNEPTIRLNA